MCMHARTCGSHVGGVEGALAVLSALCPWGSGSGSPRRSWGAVFSRVVLGEGSWESGAKLLVSPGRTLCDWGSLRVWPLPNHAGGRPGRSSGNTGRGSGCLARGRKQIPALCGPLGGQAPVDGRPGPLMFIASRPFGQCRDSGWAPETPLRGRVGQEVWERGRGSVIRVECWVATASPCVPRALECCCLPLLIPAYLAFS